MEYGNVDIAEVLLYDDALSPQVFPSSFRFVSPVGWQRSEIRRRRVSFSGHMLFEQVFHLGFLIFFFTRLIDMLLFRRNRKWRDLHLSISYIGGLQF